MNEQQARKDAAADAETLRLYWRWSLMPDGLGGVTLNQMRRAANSGLDRLAVPLAVNAAHAAFMAVPGLRGVK